LKNLAVDPSASVSVSAKSTPGLKKLEREDFNNIIGEKLKKKSGERYIFGNLEELLNED
jgi:hypothetical protein